MRGAWILVADDDVEARMELFGLLERDGYHATVAPSGSQALDLLHTEPFDLAVLGVGIAGLDGPALVGEVRGDGALDELPLLLSFVSAESPEISRLLELGAQDYLPKPFDPPVVRARVRAWLALKRLHDVQSEHRRQLRHVTDAIAGIADQTFRAADLEELARRSDPCGQLARAVIKTAAEVGRRQ